MGILMLIFTLCRLLFYAQNAVQFPDVGVYEFIIGFWFDAISCCLLFLPLVIIELFPNHDRNAKWFRRLTKGITFLIFLFGIGVNLIDVEYFGHTATRASSSLLTMLGFGNDLNAQLPSFFVDYWYLLLLLIILMWSSFWLLKRIYQKEDDSASVSTGVQTIIYLLSIGFCILIARGGFVNKPIRITEASKYVDSKNTQLVLNSAFTVINTWGADLLEEKDYMSKEEAARLFNPIQDFEAGGQLEGQNVVIIILESFAIEYISSLNSEELDYTPFFDSMVDSSLVFDYAFANGKKSIDAVPSILASIPKLMNDEFMLSPYAANEIESLPSNLGRMGYSSAFYHGATNGSMNFDAFCSQIGFEDYYGRSEYGNDDDYDGTWGIPDDKFLGWSVDKLSEMKEPFLSTIFTISSHPPYHIPAEFDEKFKSIDSEVHRSIRYTDYALELFFEKARKQEWFNNTLFILTADHTASTSREFYSQGKGKLQVPLLFYHPTDSNFRGHNRRIVSHVDIMPTLLDLLGYDEPFFAFGKSIYGTNSGLSFSQIGGKYYLFDSAGGRYYLLVFENEQVSGLYHMDDQYQSNNIMNEAPEITNQLEDRIKAVIQVYNEALILNKMTAKGRQ